MNEKIVIVKSPFFRNEILRNGCNCIPLYKNYSKTALRIGNLTRNSSLFQSYNINPLLKGIKEDTIIIFDAGIRINVLKWFLKKYKNKRLIFYYWNPVSLSINPEIIPHEFEKWSYSPDDCKQYNLKYNSTFFFPELLDNQKHTIKTDVFFIGKNKKRKSILEIYEKKFQDKRLITDFIIVDDGGNNRISYSEIIKKDSQSRCILDYYVNPHAGLSLRAMESLFLGKKLITNNEAITEYDFFCPENIFILGQRNENQLETFVNTPYQKVSQEIVSGYSFDCWINRFKNV